MSSGHRAERGADSLARVRVWMSVCARVCVYVCVSSILDYFSYLRKRRVLF